MKVTPRWAPKSIQIHTKSTLKRTRFSDSLFTQKITKNDSKMRPLFSNNFHFLMLSVRIGSFLSFSFHFLVILVTSGTEFHTLTRKSMKNHKNYWIVFGNINIFTLFWYYSDNVFLKSWCDRTRMYGARLVSTQRTLRYERMELHGAAVSRSVLDR